MGSKLHEAGCVESDQDVRIIIISFPSDLGYGLPDNAPPPRLHYTTFWKSITRKTYRKHKLDMKSSVKDWVVSNYSRKECSLSETLS